MSRKDLKDLKYYSTEVFKELGSDNYKQKLVYKLLNLIKIDNQNEFFNIFLRTLNSKDSDENVAKLAEKLKTIYPLNEKNFENVAYAIVMGIMAS
ncbi:hypothetical protein MBCUR_11950 [Methanobrevibacter curvatus]|uniref:Uncharacterized protein n=2 Tax=Methanobrevibacter curvatus TaxID=49547 RepID=A0A166AHL8_9EURY|nr:hypothetical protein MBCUR_11950 [Methanobrevibacter curvatus]